MNTIKQRLDYRAATVLLLLTFALLTCGCYESSVPLAPRETAAVDSSLFGTWLVLGQEDEQAPTHIRIRPYDAHSYEVTFCCADLLESHMEADVLRVHLVLVDSVALANVQNLREDAAPYLFFGVDRSDDGVLTLRPVASCLFAGTSLSTSEALYSFVQARLGHERLYLDEALRFKKEDD